MEISTPQIGSVIASPTKSFFVHMLTRDIELQDALLDLLDNCVDGIVRSHSQADTPGKPYEGFSATITMAEDHFIISDNCGGIPIEVAKKYAFAIGKPPGAEGEPEVATVGLYGIGMKRAIFKLGTSALVESQSDQGFIVAFTPEWMASNEWDNLPMYDLPAGRVDHGTRIEVYDLNPEAAAAFADSNWVDEFRKSVARVYSLIISKGFSVTIGTPEEIAANIAPVEAESLRLIETEPSNGSLIAPFAYFGVVGDVTVEIYAGLYRELLTGPDGELEEETRGATDDAGWTIACNDRVVVWKDKTRLTGWGEATVPNYHGQFIAITGIVLLTSKDPSKLPLTTTKRGIDAASIVYSIAKDMMREATKSLTSFTNRWKKFPAGLKSIYKGSTYVDLEELRRRAPELKTTASRKHASFRKHEPHYPQPVQESNSARISFVALKSDIEQLGSHFFHEAKVKPGDVGEAAFNFALSALKDEAQ